MPASVLGVCPFAAGPCNSGRVFSHCPPAVSGGTGDTELESSLHVVSSTASAVGQDMHCDLQQHMVALEKERSEPQTNL